MVWNFISHFFKFFSSVILLYLPSSLDQFPFYYSLEKSRRGKVEGERGGRKGSGGKCLAQIKTINEITLKKNRFLGDNNQT